ncbi:hypothetical protein ERJ75_000268800 [Trypanosoma vivax]|nr:hypothetical protein ERJ75_000268800 [Trypanosoma vivax]
MTPQQLGRCPVRLLIRRLPHDVSAEQVMGAIVAHCSDAAVNPTVDVQVIAGHPMQEGRPAVPATAIVAPQKWWPRGCASEDDGPAYALWQRVVEVVLEVFDGKVVFPSSDGEGDLALTSCVESSPVSLVPAAGKRAGDGESVWNCKIGEAHVGTIESDADYVRFCDVMQRRGDASAEGAWEGNFEDEVAGGGDDSASRDDKPALVSSLVRSLITGSERREKRRRMDKIATEEKEAERKRRRKKERSEERWKRKKEKKALEKSQLVRPRLLLRPHGPDSDGENGVVLSVPAAGELRQNRRRRRRSLGDMFEEGSVRGGDSAISKRREPKLRSRRRRELRKEEALRAGCGCDEWGEEKGAGDEVKVSRGSRRRRRASRSLDADVEGAGHVAEPNVEGSRGRRRRGRRGGERRLKAKAGKEKELEPEAAHPAAASCRKEKREEWWRRRRGSRGAEPEKEAEQDGILSADGQQGGRRRRWRKSKEDVCSRVMADDVKWEETHEDVSLRSSDKVASASSKRKWRAEQRRRHVERDRSEPVAGEVCGSEVGEVRSAHRRRRERDKGERKEKKPPLKVRFLTRDDVVSPACGGEA